MKTVIIDIICMSSLLVSSMIASEPKSIDVDNKLSAFNMEVILKPPPDCYIKSKKGDLLYVHYKVSNSKYYIGNGC